MFCTQDNQYVSPAVPGTAEKLNEILDSPRVKWKIETIRAVRKPEAIKQWASNVEFQKFCIKEAAKKKVGEAFKELTDEEKLVRWATALKESLPPLIFGARDFDETPLKKDPSRKMKRRVLAAIHLSGLFMFDVDHVDNPREIFERTQVEGFRWKVLFAHVTSSGEGLRLVCVAIPEVGNIADNQIELAKALGVTPDLSCIDASRISYAPMREDVYYLNEEELVNYYNEEFDKMYCEAYRKGCTEPTKAQATKEVRIEKGEAKRGRPRKVAPQALETATEQCCNWLSTLGISATISPTWSLGHLRSADLYRTSSASEAKKRCKELLIRLVSEECTKTSPSECRRCLKVQVYCQATHQQLSELWTKLTSLTSSTLKGWNLSLALLMPKPVAE